ncbi:MAG: DUF3048 domain-containing protein [Anaerolineales bacterium]
MKKVFPLLLLLLTFAGACTPASAPTEATVAPLPTATPLPAPTATASPQPSATPAYPPEGRGPADFPANVNPLTGLEVADPALLERRPLAIKVENLPRNHRPQYGLSRADLVYEYYTEEGTTRFIAIFYGQDADTVGPIRSARFFDANIVRAYKAILAFGSADERVLNRLHSAEFADRLVVEGPNTPLRRLDPNGYNLLVVDTAALSQYAVGRGIDGGRQDLTGMFFQMTPPEGGQSAASLTVRYSAAIYNRWDYDPVTGRYLRFADAQNDYSGGAGETYEPLLDRATGQQLAFDNVVVLFVTHEAYSRTPEMWDILLTGSGRAFACRDGQVYEVTWQRNAPNAVLSLAYADGSPFPFKPGATWFEVVGLNSEVQPGADGWRFVHQMP